MGKDVDNSDRYVRRRDKQALRGLVRDSGFGSLTDDDTVFNHFNVMGGLQKRMRSVDKPAVTKAVAAAQPQMSSEQRAAAEVEKAKKDPATAKRLALMREALDRSQPQPPAGT